MLIANSVAHVNPTMPPIDLIPFEILLLGNAIMVYLCACGFFVTLGLPPEHF
jgi:hypothetical protein